jgi:putative transposase
MGIKKFTSEQKLAILKEAEEIGVVKTLEKYGIFTATFYRWKEDYAKDGEAGLHSGLTAPQVKRIRELEKENMELKAMLAESALTQRMKDKLSQKKILWNEKK